MIKFNKIYYTGREIDYIKDAMKFGLQSNGEYDKKVKSLLYKQMNISHAFLVNSCTAALEISALALDIKPGDEVIMPSYTYVSTANAFALRGAKIIFVDIEEDTMNINIDKIEDAITSKTKVIVPVHYGGVSCDMDRLMKLAKEKNIYVVEDAAQGIYSKYKDEYLGNIGHIGCISLHETKNITSGGEGGILIVNDYSLMKKIEILVEKGTDRIKFLNKEVSKYTWKDLGSSYLMSELNSSFLLAQLEEGIEITKRRTDIFNKYNKAFSMLIDDGSIEVLKVPEYSLINGHMYYIKTKDRNERDDLIKFLNDKNIEGFTHYEPLHLSEGGEKYGEYVGSDEITTKEAGRILRLPLHMHLTNGDIEAICEYVKEFYDK